MQRNLDKDDIRDASDLLTHIDGWEKTGSYDAEAIDARSMACETRAYSS